jgi:hypothetical protein
VAFTSILSNFQMVISVANFLCLTIATQFIPMKMWFLVRFLFLFFVTFNYLCSLFPLNS